MPRYRFDFFDLNGAVFALHEIDYSCDKTAIAAGHSINGFPTIGAGFRIWRNGHLIYRHRNVLHSGQAREQSERGKQCENLRSAKGRFQPHGLSFGRV